MSAAEVLNVQVRDETGKRKVRRLRANGMIPAVLYGHGQQVVSLSVPADEVNAALRHGNRVVALQGGLNEQVFIREVQWDTFGHDVLHLDFTRVQAGEMLETTVLLECRGDAPGTHAGGVVEQPLHELEIRCPPEAMTDRIEVNINALELGQSITVGDLELPRGAEALAEADMVVVQCVERVEEEEESEATGPAEPEVIGRKEDEDAESS
jgi:large subunit ribosomal protein L25